LNVAKQKDYLVYYIFFFGLQLFCTSYRGEALFKYMTHVYLVSW